MHVFKHYFFRAEKKNTLSQVRRLYSDSPVIKNIK